MGAPVLMTEMLMKADQQEKKSLFVPARPIPEPISNQLDNRNAKFVIQS